MQSFASVALGNPSANPAPNRFSAHKNGSDQALTSGVLTTVTAATELWDTGGEWATDTFTPVAGVVIISAAIYLTGTTPASTFATVDLYKNGAFFRRLYRQIAGYTTLQCTCAPVTVAASGMDAFQIKITVDTAGVSVEGDATNTWIEAHAIP